MYDRDVIIGQLQSHRQQPDRQITQWLEQIPEKLRKNLVRIGLLDTKYAAAGKPIGDMMGVHLNRKNCVGCWARHTIARNAFA